MIVAKLPTTAVEKPWGVVGLPEPFTSSSAERIGEIWFDPPADCPLLAKYLFTSERLSIQVHPDDAEARARGLLSGKEECWYILEAEPDAKLGIGTVRALGAAELREAALSGMIEELIEWHPVEAGMFFHVPPGTVHAIGGGISLVEIQQKSDVTYRLYDYGRPRELHLEDGAAVARAAPMAKSLQRAISPNQSVQLLGGARLSVAYIAGNDLAPIAGATGPLMIVPLMGHVEAGGVSVGAGECLWGARAGAIAAEGDARFLVAGQGWP